MSLEALAAMKLARLCDEHLLPVDLRYFRQLHVADLPCTCRVPALFIVANMWVPSVCEAFMAALRSQVADYSLGEGPSAEEVVHPVIFARLAAARHEDAVRSGAASDAEAARLVSEYREMNANGSAYHWGPARCFTRLGLCRKVDRRVEQGADGAHDGTVEAQPGLNNPNAS